MVPERLSTATEQSYLEDNIATVAFHLGQPGARLKDTEAEPIDAITMLRRIYRQDGKMTTEDWAILCRIVREAEKDD